MYRPPSSDVSEFLSSLDSTLHLVDPEREEVLLVGDFNATSPYWLPSDAYNAAGAVLEPAFLQLGLTQHVRLSTHLRPGGNLDLPLIWFCLPFQMLFLWSIFTHPLESPTTVLFSAASTSTYALVLCAPVCVVCGHTARQISLTSTSAWRLLIGLLCLPLQV